MTNELHRALPAVQPDARLREAAIALRDDMMERSRAGIGAAFALLNTPTEGQQ